MWAERRTAADIVAAEGLAQVSDGGELEEACRRVIAAHPDRGGPLQGQPQAHGLLRRPVMKATGGKGNPKTSQ